MKTKLIEAIEDENYEEAKQLIDENDVEYLNEQEDKYGFTALHYAIEKGNDELVQKLIDQNADVNITSKGTAPLHWAAAKGQVTALQTLIESNADLEARENHGDFTALHRAAYARQPGTTAALLEAKADVNAIENEINDTALHSSQTLLPNESSCEVASLLLQFKANPNARNLWEEIPLDSYPMHTSF